MVPDTLFSSGLDVSEYAFRRCTEDLGVIVIEGAFEPYILTLPYPTCRMGFLMKGDNVSRSAPMLHEGIERALLIFDGVSEEVDGPYGRMIEMEIELLRGVRTIDDALRHFVLENGDLNLLEQTGVITTESFPVGNVMTIDLARAGWIPGNTYSYVFTNPFTATEILWDGNRNQFKAELGALYIHPTFFHEFDWQRASINVQIIDMRSP